MAFKQVLVIRLDQNRREKCCNFKLIYIKESLILLTAVNLWILIRDNYSVQTLWIKIVSLWWEEIHWSYDLSNLWKLPYDQSEAWISDTRFYSQKSFSRLSGRPCEVIESECLERSLLAWKPASKIVLLFVWTKYRESAWCRETERISSFWRFSTAVHSAGSAADYQHGQPCRHLYQQPSSITDLGHSRDRDKIHEKVQKTKSTRLRYIVKIALLVCWKFIEASIFRNSLIVKRKPKFLWTGLVIVFVEWTLLKVQFGLFNHIRMYYPMYRSYFSISEDRAVRVTYERERLLDDKGNLSLDTSAGSQTMKEGIKDNLVDLRTIVKYKNRETKTLHEITSQCLLKTSEDTKNQGFEVLSLAR